MQVLGVAPQRQRDHHWLQRRDGTSSSRMAAAAAPNTQRAPYCCTHTVSWSQPAGSVQNLIPFTLSPSGARGTVCSPAGPHSQAQTQAQGPACKATHRWLWPTNAHRTADDGPDAVQRPRLVRQLMLLDQITGLQGQRDQTGSKASRSIRRVSSRSWTEPRACRVDDSMTTDRAA